MPTPCMKTTQFETLNRDKENGNPPTHNSNNNLDLRLGISSDEQTDTYQTGRNNKRLRSFQDEQCDGSFANKRSTSYACDSFAFDYNRYLFSQYPTSFVDPWSLAARQQKAVAEQAHLKLRNPHSFHMLTEPVSPPTTPTSIGWPPIHSSRRNLVTINLPKSNETNNSDSNNEKTVEISNLDIQLELKHTMYVKVNFEGYFVGRKIDLTSHDNYESLSKALQIMFSNFLTNYSNAKEVNADESDFVLLYEDHEGDRMLVGDVPWELFITSLKRLYITRSSSAREKAFEGVKNDQNEENTTI